MFGDDQDGIAPEGQQKTDWGLGISDFGKDMGLYKNKNHYLKTLGEIVISY